MILMNRDKTIPPFFHSRTLMSLIVGGIDNQKGLEYFQNILWYWGGLLIMGRWKIEQNHNSYIKFCHPDKTVCKLICSILSHVEVEPTNVSLDWTRYAHWFTYVRTMYVCMCIFPLTQYYLQDVNHAYIYIH